MKKTPILIALVAIALNATGQQHIVTYWDVLHQTKQEVYDLNKNGEKEGKYIAYASDGSINVERFYKNGLMNGKETLYYNEYGRSGLSHISNFKDDKQDGLQQSYECNGGTYYRYVCGEEFYKNGNLIWKKTYDVDDKNKRCLRKEELYNDGANNPYLTKGYKQNGHQFYQIAKEGLNWQEADAGANKLEFYTANGKKEGLYKEWYDNGHLADSCYYKNDLQDGYEFQWYPNGNLKFTRNFSYGNLNGDVNDYDTTGTLKSTVKFTNGVRILTKDDIHGAIDLIRAGKNHEGDEALKQIMTQLDLGYDSVRVVVKLFMKCNSCNSYSNEWIDRMLTRYSDKLGPADYISISNFKIRSEYDDGLEPLTTGLQKFPDNHDLIFQYAHINHYSYRLQTVGNQGHAERIEVVNQDDHKSYPYYEKWLAVAGIDSTNKTKFEEANLAIANYYVQKLGNPAANPAICGSEESNKTEQKINQYIETLKRIGANALEIRKLEQSYDSYKSDCSVYGKLNHQQNNEPSGKKKVTIGSLFK